VEDDLQGRQQSIRSVARVFKKSAPFGRQRPSRRALSIHRSSHVLFVVSRTSLTLALFLPLTIGGLGVREGTLIGILALYGYEKETAIAVSFIAFSFVIMLAIIGASLSFTIRPPRKAVYE
jgi:uncharacterized membrane protein YbhN (UPF0104 family)